MTEKRPEKIAAFVIPTNTLLARIRALAASSNNVRWSHHARERMAERDISLRVALTALQLGFIVGEVEPGQNPGEWKAKVVRRKKGMRDIGVVVVVVREDHLLVKTVEWEDFK